jgi:hypothetical protein
MGTVCVAVLGEPGKVVMISAYRFASISVIDGALRVALRGEKGEKVPLLFAKRAGCKGPWVTSLVVATVGAKEAHGGW